MISEIRLKRVAASFLIAVAIALYAPAPFATAQPAAAPAAQAAPALDYEVFKTTVEPIFLKRRSPAHAPLLYLP